MYCRRRSGVKLTKASDAACRYNYGQNTTLVADLHSTEYRFLQHVPEHPNIVAVLGVIRACPLTENIVVRLPQAAREAASQKNKRTGRTRFLPTTGLLLERLPLTLEQHVAALGDALDNVAAISLAAQVVEALHHLHACGVVHGDLKPNNCMVDSARTPCRVVLVDFGCAVLRGPRSTDMNDSMTVIATESTNITLGNQAHLAPEVLAALARKGKLSRGSDKRIEIPLGKQSSFAAGVLLYELAMGLDSPILGYPAVGCSPAEFETVDFDGLAHVVSHEYALIVRGLLCYDPENRLPISAARNRLSNLFNSVTTSSMQSGPTVTGVAGVDALPAPPKQVVGRDVRRTDAPRQFWNGTTRTDAERMQVRECIDTLPAVHCGSRQPRPAYATERDWCGGGLDSEKTSGDANTATRDTANVQHCGISQEVRRPVRTASDAQYRDKEALEDSMLFGGHHVRQDAKKLPRTANKCNVRAGGKPSSSTDCMKATEGNSIFDTDESDVDVANDTSQQNEGHPRRCSKGAAAESLLLAVDTLSSPTDVQEIRHELDNVIALANSAFGEVACSSPQVVEAVVGILQEHRMDRATVIKACQALKRLGVDLTNQERFSQAGGLVALADVLAVHSTQCPAVAAALAAAIKAMTHCSAKNAAQFGKTQGIHHLIQAAQTFANDAPLAVATCQTLSTTCTDAACINLGNVAGAIDLLVRLIKMHENVSSVLQACFQTLGDLAQSSRLCQDRCGQGERLNALRIALQHHSAAPVAMSACFAFSAITQDHGINQERCGSVGIVEVLVKIVQLHSNNTSVLPLACSALTNMASAKVNQSRFGACRGVDMIMRVLRAHPLHVATAAAACSTFATMCVGHAGNAGRCSMASGIKAVVSVLQTHAGTPNSLTAGFRALRLLSQLNDTSKVACATCGAVSVLVKVLRSVEIDAETAVETCAALANLAMIHKVRSQVGACDGVKALLDIIRSHAKDSRVTTQATIALGNVGLNPQNKAICAARNAVSVLYHVMRVHSSNIAFLRAACRTLRNLSHNKEIKAQCISSGCAKMLVGILRKHRRNASVVVHACTALGNIATTQKNMRACGQFGAVDAVFDVLEWHVSNAALVEAVCRTLGNLACEPRNRAVCTRHRSFALVKHALKLHKNHAGVARAAKQTRNSLNVARCCVQ